MAQHKGLTAPQNTFLNTIVARSNGANDAFVLGNAHPQHYPIVYCSDGFLVLTQYPRASVMSRSCLCHFLWGPRTTIKDRTRIVHAFQSRAELFIELVFYKRTGEPFFCELNINPIKNEKGCVVLFLCNFVTVNSSRRWKRQSIDTALSYADMTYLPIPRPGFENRGSHSENSLSQNTRNFVGSKSSLIKQNCENDQTKPNRYLRKSCTDLVALYQQRCFSKEIEHLAQDSHHNTNDSVTLSKPHPSQAHSLFSSCMNRARTAVLENVNRSYSLTLQAANEVSHFGKHLALRHDNQRIGFRLDQKNPPRVSSSDLGSGRSIGQPSLDSDQGINILHSSYNTVRPVFSTENSLNHMYPVCTTSSNHVQINLNKSSLQPSRNRSLGNPFKLRSTPSSLSPAVTRADDAEKKLIADVNLAHHEIHESWTFSSPFHCTAVASPYTRIPEGNSKFLTENPTSGLHGLTSCETHSDYSSSGVDMETSVNPQITKHFDNVDQSEGPSGSKQTHSKLSQLFRILLNMFSIVRRPFGSQNVAEGRVTLNSKWKRRRKSHITRSAPMTPFELNHKKVKRKKCNASNRCLALGSASTAVCRSVSNSPSSSSSVTAASDGEEPDPSKYSFKRRKSVAILHNIPIRKQKKRKRQINKQIKNFSGKNMPEYKIQQFPKPNSVLLHYGIFRIVWDWILLLFTFYIAFMVPYYVTFGRRTGLTDTRKRIVDLVVEVLLIVDIVVNFNTTYVNKNGQLVHDRRQLAIRYLRSWFLIDVLAALPVDFMLAAVQTIWNSELEMEQTKIGLSLVWSKEIDRINMTKDQTRSMKHPPMSNWNIVSLLQVMKLAKLLRLARLFENLSRSSQHSIVVLGLLMFTFTLVAHWCACIWYVIGETDESEAGWLYELARRLNFTYRWNQTEPLNEASRYFTALYFTCSSLTSVGFGNVSANTTEEKIFAICIMLLGALMHAAVFGNVTAIIQRIYARRTAFQSRTQDLKDFVRVHRIPKPLKRRMEDFFQTTWAINRGIDLSDVLAIYPEELRRDIALHLNRELLSMKVFRNASQDCLKSLALQIKTTFSTPGEYLIHSGDILRRLYFVCSGSLEILENDEVVALLGKNDWFGTYMTPDGDFSQTVRSRCDVKSLTYCDLQSIELVALNEVLNQYPQFKSEFAAYLYEDLSFNIQEGARFMDSDAVLVPAITLQLMRDNSSSPNPSSASHAWEQSQSRHSSEEMKTGTTDVVSMEEGLLSTNTNILEQHDRLNRSTGTFQPNSTTCWSSDGDGMRYYPRRSITDKRKTSIRDTNGAKFYDMINPRSSRRKNLSRSSNLCTTKVTDQGGMQLISGEWVYWSHDKTGLRTNYPMGARRYTHPVTEYIDESSSSDEKNPPDLDIHRTLARAKKMTVNEIELCRGHSTSPVQTVHETQSNKLPRYHQLPVRTCSLPIQKSNEMNEQSTLDCSLARENVICQPQTILSFHSSDNNECLRFMDGHFSETGATTKESGSEWEERQREWRSVRSSIHSHRIKSNPVLNFKLNQCQKRHSYPITEAEEISAPILVHKELKHLQRGMWRLELQISQMMQLIQSGFTAKI